MPTKLGPIFTKEISSFSFMQNDLLKSTKKYFVLLQYSQMRIAFKLILMLKIHVKIGDFTFFEDFSQIQGNM